MVVNPPDDADLIGRALSWRVGPWPNLEHDAPDLAATLGALGEGISDGLLGVGASDWDEQAQVEHWTHLWRTFDVLGSDLERMATDNDWPGQW